MKSSLRYLIHDRPRATRLPLTSFPGWKPRLRFRTVCPDGSLYLITELNRSGAMPVAVRRQTWDRMAKHYCNDCLEN